jgi:type I restriction enzyme R subunit
MIDPKKKEQLETVQKDRFKLFDFFANCEYFEEKFNYNEVLKVPKQKSQAESAADSPLAPDYYEVYNSNIDDRLSTLNQKEIGPEGMKVDWMFFERFGHIIMSDHPIIKEQYEAGK